ncbi:hypothetical protein VB715_10545 [Crocosphaera sp. UHCC 0190]|uniref:hypothetical protein n=1 Tax=Crocosphaera sp. UHCC 0190 TaxID=3110246 RepID=UPI002B2130B5|nr:hypothetical protein [Crocosphaera sp. UHCC 0190]MEA5510200.1 hypothetical protein [Crocosphaera sp. UHCC 0190]
MKLFFAYQPNDQWKIEGALKRFRDNYLSRDWKSFCKQDGKIIKIYRDLRHRNAHPDWLFTQGGYLSKEQMEKSLDDMIFLSRFYGYMILAIAGVKELKPEFPSPHKESPPLCTLYPKPSKSYINLQDKEIAPK